MDKHTFLFLASRDWQVRYQVDLIDELRAYLPDIKPIIISIEKWTGGNAKKEADRLKIPCINLTRPSQKKEPFWAVEKPLKEISQALESLRNDIIKILENHDSKTTLFLDNDDNYISNLIIHLVKSNSGAVILYQHGYEKICEFHVQPFYVKIFNSIRRYIRHIAFFGYLPIRPKGCGNNGSDLNLVYSEAALLAYKNNGVKERSLKCVGNMSLDRLITQKQRYNVTYNGKILVCTPGYYRMNNLNLHRMTKKFIEKLVEKWGNDVSIDIRLKPGELPNAAKYLHDMLSNGRIEYAANDEPIVKIAKKYDFVVSYTSSNVAFECIVTKIPVVIYKLSNNKYNYLSELYNALQIQTIYQPKLQVVALDEVYKKIKKPPILNESIIWKTGPLDGKCSNRAAEEIKKFITYYFNR